MDSVEIWWLSRIESKCLTNLQIPASPIETDNVESGVCTIVSRWLLFDECHAPWKTKTTQWRRLAIDSETRRVTPITDNRTAVRCWYSRYSKTKTLLQIQNFALIYSYWSTLSIAIKYDSDVNTAHLFTLWSSKQIGPSYYYFLIDLPTAYHV